MFLSRSFCSFGPFRASIWHGVHAYFSCLPRFWQYGLLRIQSGLNLPHCPIVQVRPPPCCHHFCPCHHPSCHHLGSPNRLNPVRHLRLPSGQTHRECLARYWWCCPAPQISSKARHSNLNADVPHDCCYHNAVVGLKMKTFSVPLKFGSCSYCAGTIGHDPFAHRYSHAAVAVQESVVACEQTGLGGGGLLQMVLVTIRRRQAAVVKCCSKPFLQSYQSWTR